MTGSKLVFDEDTHTYKVDGKPLPSVTDICSVLESYKDISPEVLRQAARRGSLIHEYTQLIDYGVPVEDLEIEPELAGYVLAYVRFLRDYKPTWEMVEQPLFSLELGYAGTLDRYGTIDGQPTFVDIKSVYAVTRPLRITWAAQLAGYRKLHGKTESRLLNLVLCKDGTYKLYYAEDSERRYGFNAADLFDTLLDMKKLLGGKKCPKNTH